MERERVIGEILDRVKIAAEEGKTFVCIKTPSAFGSINLYLGANDDQAYIMTMLENLGYKRSVITDDIKNIGYLSVEWA